MCSFWMPTIHCDCAFLSDTWNSGYQYLQNITNNNVTDLLKKTLSHASDDFIFDNLASNPGWAYCCCELELCLPPAHLLWHTNAEAGVVSHPRVSALHNTSAVKSNLLLTSLVTPFSTKMPLSQISVLFMLNVQICAVAFMVEAKMLSMILITCFES